MKENKRIENLKININNLKTKQKYYICGSLSLGISGGFVGLGAPFMQEVSDYVCSVPAYTMIVSSGLLFVLALKKQTKINATSEELEKLTKQVTR